jgi:hypothetical protein
MAIMKCGVDLKNCTDLISPISVSGARASRGKGPAKNGFPILPRVSLTDHENVHSQDCKHLRDDAMSQRRGIVLLL